MRSISLCTLLVSSLMVTVGCASSAPQNADKPAPASGMPRVGERAISKVEGAIRLDRHAYQLYKGRSMQTVSLVGILNETGKDVAIFQFAGVDCLSCQDEARELEKKLATDANGKSIAHILVITDFFKDYRDDEFTKFKADNAPSSTLAYDEARIWKAFSKDPSLPNRATIFAMNSKSDAIIFKEEGKQHGIFEAAVSLLKGP